MRPATKLAAFALVVAGAFGVGAAVGTAAGPIDVGGDDGHPAEHDEGPSTTTAVHPTDHEAVG